MYTGILTAVILGMIPARAWAQEAVPATPEAVQLVEPEKEIGTITMEKDATTQQNTTQILQNLENLVHDDSQSVEIISQYDDVVSKARGFIAQVSNIKDDSFKISLPEGGDLLITPDKSTTIVKNGDSVRGDQAQMSEWLEVDNWLVLIGIQNGETFQPRRIMVSGESLAPAERFVHAGVVKNITAAKVDVAITGEGETVETYQLTKSTALLDQNNETITHKEIEKQAPVLVIGELKNTAKSLQTLRLL